jgi:ATP-dependent RNA helicase RhlE
MLDMGFLPALKRIAAALPTIRQTMCFSATMEASVAHLVKDYMRNPVRLAFGSTLKPSENVRMQAFEVSADLKQRTLNRLLAKETGRCLVFARTKRATDRICKNLNRDGFSAAMIHGDRSQSQRNSALAGFQQGRYRVLVATDVASRGIHVQDVAHVINFDLPEIAENFIHRVGRTGRAGKHGVASTLFGREQRSELFQLERTLGIKMERMRAEDGASVPAAEQTGRLPEYREQRPTVTGGSFGGRHKPNHGSGRDSRRDSRHYAAVSGVEPVAARSQMVRLPGEVFQVEAD